MKKLLLFSALFFTMGTTFATVQDDVAAVLAKTKYKNIMTFLGEVSIHPDFCANGIVYESDYPMRVVFYDGYIGNRSWLSDTVSLCKGNIPVDVWNDYYDKEYPDFRWLFPDHIHSDYVEDTLGFYDGFYSTEESVQDYVYYDDSLVFFEEKSNVSSGQKMLFTEGKDHEVFFIQLSYFKDKKVHIRYRRMVVRNTSVAQEIKVKYELIDNDIKGRVALTNLTVGDSVFFRFCDANYHYSENQKFTKYLFFDTIPTWVTIENYYKGCMTDYGLSVDSATEMPRIHDTVVEYVKDTIVEYVKDTIVEYVKDTIYITKTDTIYITKTDTVYIEKEPNKTAIINKQTNLNVWPNPTTTFVNAEAEEPFSYTLLNNAGVILKKEEGEPSYTISMKEYPDGVYFIKTSDGVIRKIVKK